MPDALLARWGRTLRAHRSAADLTQEEVAARLAPPVSQATIARWELGQREPRRHYRPQLAAIYGTHVAVLFAHNEPEAVA